MAEETGHAKTEAPTPRRREKSREQGQFAYSAELGNAVILLAGALVMWFGGSAAMAGLLRIIRADLLSIGRMQWQIENSAKLTFLLLAKVAQFAGPVVVLTLTASVAVGLYQAGFQITLDPLKPNWNRLSLSKGWHRVFSLPSVVRGAMAVLKLSSIGLLVAWVIHGQLERISASGQGSLFRAAALGWNITLMAVLSIIGAMMVIGLVDYLFQWWRNEQGLKMSRQELKDEQKRDEGDPMIRARIKKLQREASQRKMILDVPKATVVLTNPTHIAVALRYDRTSMKAPSVVARGGGVTAKRIVQSAKRHNIPVLERKLLARALYRSVDVGQEIPVALYHAIAEILAYVYRLNSAA